jgi:hypothetical protein
MKNAIVSGLFIGILSGLYIFIMHMSNISPQSGGNVQPIEYGSVFIPLLVLYFGIRNYRKVDCNGQMGFLEALIQSFKILIIGGIIAVSASIIYIDEFTKESNLLIFSERIFGALLVGILFALGVSLSLTNKRNKVD